MHTRMHTHTHARTHARISTPYERIVQLVATGHSLGAGVAGIAAVDLAHTPLRYAGGEYP
jgi:hypothetical protein